MWPMLGRATASTPQNIFRRGPRDVLKERSNSKLWVCQRCYHSDQRTLNPEREVGTAQRYHRRRIRVPNVSPSICYSRTLSTGSSNAEDKARSDLPSQEEGRRSHMSKRFSHLMDNVQSNIFIAGQRLNDLTGYSGIETLKKDIEQQGRSVVDPLSATTMLTLSRDAGPSFSNNVAKG